MKQNIAVIYKDADILAIVKPSGILSVPDRYDDSASIVSQELSMKYGRLWTLHRLDKDTSGVLLFARNADAHQAMSKLFEDRAIQKEYEAIVHGRPSWETHTCELKLLTDGDRLHRTVVDRAGKPALTIFSLIGSYKNMSIIEAKPVTGRTHQIRVHLASVGLPVACDPLYGDGKPLYLSSIKRRWNGDTENERPLIERTALHAKSVTFVHPFTGENIKLEAPYPKDFKAALFQIKKL